ncbi:MAG: hypothetical protein EHM20_08765 [Alphaproteobacteria bacterium]|nr:MAG: hypothetical protein EHM20_08765 [Alphaproteobacteria bacterium]
MKKYVYTILSVLLASIMVVGCTDNSPQYINGNPDLLNYVPNTNYTNGTPEQAASTLSVNEETTQPTLGILSHNLQKDDNYGGYSVIGTAKAAGNISYAEVRVKFYDKDGNLIESGFDNILDLAAGETWSFKVTCYSTDENIENYKIAVGN